MMMHNNDQKTPTIVSTVSATEVVTVSSEVVSFLLEDGTADAGSAAGTIALGTTAQAPILNVFGDRIGEYSGEAISTSIVFTNGAMLNGQEKGFVYDALGNRRITKTIEKLTTNGDWACDYATGLFIVKKATAGTSQTLTTYKVRTGGGGGSPSNPSEIQGKDADNAPATANPVIVSGEYNATPPTYADGDNASLQSDINGNLWTRGSYMPVAEDNTNGYYNTTRKYTATNTDKGTKGQNNSFATANVKNTAGSMVWANIINTTASVRYFQLHNTATTPGAGATAAYKWQIPANGYLTLDADLLGANGANLQTGIAIANSSTAATYTAGSAGDLLVDYITI